MIPTGYGAALLQTLFALAAVCVLSWIVLRVASKPRLGLGSRMVRVRERIALDARSSLHLVEVGDTVLLVGTNIGASPTVLREIDPKTLPREEESKFARILRGHVPRS